MSNEKLISLILGLFISSSVVGQTLRTTAPSKPQAPATGVESAKTATPVATAALSTVMTSAYSWQIRPNDNDGYFSSDIPQPVCALVGGVAKIFIFTNFDYYPSINFNNYSNSVRVGEITTPADTYQLLPHNLPGKRQEFAATSILTTGPNHTIFIFGGKNSSGDLDEVYSYTPGSGFQFVTHIPFRNGKAGARAGAVAVPANGKIYLFGGAQGGNTVLDQVLEFDPVTQQFTPNMFTMTAFGGPLAFHGARGMTKAVGTANYIYLVGARTTAYGAPNDLIYRFNPQTGLTTPVMDASNPSTPKTIPPGSGYPMITWDPSGNIKILAASGNGTSGPWTWGNIQAWTLTDNYSNPNVAIASLSPAPYTNPTRARDMAGTVKCGSSTYLIGGTYGHGTTFQNRGMLVDRLAGLSLGPVKTLDVKILSTQKP